MSNFSHKMEYLCCCSCCSWSFHMGDEDDLHVTAKSWLLLLTLQTSLSLSLLLVILITIIGQETCMASHWKSEGIKKRIGNKKSIYYKTAKKQTTTSKFDDCLVSHTQLFGNRRVCLAFMISSDDELSKFPFTMTPGNPRYINRESVNSSSAKANRNFFGVVFLSLGLLEVNCGHSMAFSR